MYVYNSHHWKSNIQPLLTQGLYRSHTYAYFCAWSSDLLMWTIDLTCIILFQLLRVLTIGKHICLPWQQMLNFAILISVLPVRVYKSYQSSSVAEAAIRPHQCVASNCLFEHLNTQCIG